MELQSPLAITGNAGALARVDAQVACLYHLASLLDYPDVGVAHLEECTLFVWRELEEATDLLADWRHFLQTTPLEQMQEIYTHTFDLNPVCTLDFSHYLFGEDYRRGVFLAHLRESMEEAGIDAGGELPDHLPVVLRWLARIYGTELYQEMVTECILPALAKMEECFADGANPYKGVVQTVALYLERSLSSFEPAQT